MDELRLRPETAARAAAPATVVVNYVVADCEPKAAPIEPGTAADFALKIEIRQLAKDSAVLGLNAAVL